MTLCDRLKALLRPRTDKREYSTLEHLDVLERQAQIDRRLRLLEAEAVVLTADDKEH